MCFKRFLLHNLICIVYLLKYLNKNVTVAFNMCRNLYCFLDDNNRSRAVLTVSWAPGKSGAPGLTPTQPLIGKKTVNVYKIKHIYIVLVFPTKSVFKQGLEKHTVHNIHI